MIKQRADSIKQYEEAGRIELAEGERAEVKVIEEFMPSKLSDDEANRVITEVIASVQATSIRDMGKVMSKLKSLYEGQMDFKEASTKIKTFLSN